MADATTFAAWGIDYLKYDNCNNQLRPAIERYQAMGDALAATGRPIVFSLCEWGQNKPWEWGRLWAGALADDGRHPRQHGSRCSRSRQADWPGNTRPERLERSGHARGGQRQDDEHQYIHFSLWALLNAPLIAGNDLRSMSDGTRDPQESGVIAVNQDWGGSQGYKLKATA